MMVPRLTSEILLRAYASGVFPMAESAQSAEIFWISPKRRGIFHLDRLHISHSLAKTIRKSVFEVRIDTCFRHVMEECAALSENRSETWINKDILDAYTALFEDGFAHSVECWCDGVLVGGLYGVSLQSAFFGESMFSRMTDASKVALVYLVARLRRGGYTLLDTQFVTPHLARLGAVEITDKSYKNKLKKAMSCEANFHALDQLQPYTGADIIRYAQEDQERLS